jgi:DNA-binding response OmpR family regulator
MKQVLIIDESPALRDFLRQKLAGFGLEATVAINGLDGIAKIRHIQPDLVVIDYHLTRQTCLEVLDEKRRDPNIAGVPVVVLAQRLDQRRIIELVQYNVKKVFMKPIHIDAFYQTVASMLGLTIEIDTTPGIIEAHVNEDIIFVEIAQGLNREKIDLLGLKLIELIELYDIRVPKIILMFSDLKLSFVDGSNLQKIFETVLGKAKAKPRNIRVLTKDGFIRQYVDGRREYAGIVVAEDLQLALTDLLTDLNPRLEYGERKAQIIGERVLNSTSDSQTEAVQLKFDADKTVSNTLVELKEAGRVLRIAAVDDDMVIQALLKTSFGKLDAVVVPFADGEEYLQAAGKEEFDLVFLDLMMPKVGGFAVLAELKARDLHPPIIILSALSQRDAVVSAYSQGVKSYLVKPLSPDAILKKAIEILKPTL